MDAKFGLAFLDVEVAFEIVVPLFSGIFSKGAQAKQDFSVASQTETAGAANANISAGEIDPGEIAVGFENRRVAKTRIVKIGVMLESSAGEIDSATLAPSWQKSRGSP
jgi:hypothetical protein